MSKEVIANFLKQLRKTSGLSVDDVIEKLKEYDIEISSKTLYGYEGGNSMLNADVFVSLCRIYKCENPMAIFGNASIEAEEMNVIYMYRNLDKDGKELIISILERESEKITEIEKLKKQISEIGKAAVNKPTIMRSWAYYGKIACAGVGFYFDDIPTDRIEAPDRDDADFIIGVSGESMEPDYHDGEKLYVKKTDRVNRGEVGIFTINNECFLKEFGEDGLVSRNEKYKDIKGNEDVRFIGKVVGKVE